MLWLAAACSDAPADPGDDTQPGTSTHGEATDSTTGHPATTGTSSSTDGSGTTGEPGPGNESSSSDGSSGSTGASSDGADLLCMQACAVAVECGQRPDASACDKACEAALADDRLACASANSLAYSCTSRASCDTLERECGAAWGVVEQLCNALPDGCGYAATGTLDGASCELELVCNGATEALVSCAAGQCTCGGQRSGGCQSDVVCSDLAMGVADFEQYVGDFFDSCCR